MEKKKLIIIGGSIIGGIILILIIAFVISLFKPTYLSYEELEEEISKAAEEYYKTNPTMLPVSDGEHSLSYSQLVDGEFIKPLDELLKNPEGCTASILVVKYEDNFSYIPYLNCPGEYETKELYKAILDNNQIVTEKKGLYQENNEYIFKGEVKNNYLKFSEEATDYWKIVKINSDNTIKIVQETPTLEKYYTWDNRYNEDRKSANGYNDFERSRMKDTLIELSNSETLLTDSQKSNLVAKNWCIGKRGEKETDKTGAVECSVMSEDKILFGLLTIGEIINASLDEKCTTSIDYSCINYNHLTKSNTNTWSITTDSNSSYRAYYYNMYGLNLSITSTTRKISIATNISNRAFYKKGNGTYEDPYIMR